MGHLLGKKGVPVAPGVDVIRHHLRNALALQAISDRELNRAVVQGLHGDAHKARQGLYLFEHGGEVFVVGPAREGDNHILHAMQARQETPRL